MSALNFDATKVAPLESIDALKARADILGIVQRYTEVKRKGGSSVYWGCCPLHSENTPSFKIDTRTQRFHCFGCSQHGDVLDLLGGAERLDTGGAIRRLRMLLGDTSETKAQQAQPPAPAVDREAEERRE